MLRTEAKVEQGEIVEMLWVGSLESLQSVLRRPRFVDAPLKIQTWVPTKLDLISPLVDWLMNLIKAARVPWEGSLNRISPNCEMV